MNRIVFMLYAFFIVFISDLAEETNGYRVIDVDGVPTILAISNETVPLECQEEVQMTYCGFKHPDGRRFSFTGADLKNGRCVIRRIVTKQDEGEWRCHIGAKFAGVETIHKINLRIVDNLAAVPSNISIAHKKDITLVCTTTKELTPLSYCRFEPPKGTPFSIDQNVKATQPILGRYYYPRNRSLDRGDCAVTITKVRYEDVGYWVCGAGFSDGKEYTDVILLQVEGLYTMSTATSVGIAFGVLGVASFICALSVVAWKKRSRTRRSESCEDIPIEELEPRARASSRTSRTTQRSPHRTPEPSPKITRIPLLAHRSPEPSPKITRIPLLVIESPSSVSAASSN